MRIGALLCSAFPNVRMKIDTRYRWLPHPSQTQTARLLDIGCGNGDFLALAKEAGWNVFGCDPDPSARSIASQSGAEIRAGGAEAWLESAGSFDAVTMSHVLEHVPDPVTTLQEVHALLRPGGFLYLELPNIEAIGHEFYGQFWRGLEVPRHLSLPSRRLLHLQLHQIGFREINFINRKGMMLWLARDSARMEVGSSPYDDHLDDKLRLPEDRDLIRSRNMDFRAEFLTITCRRPEK